MAEIEYFYSANSLFAYLGAARLTEIVKAVGGFEQGSERNRRDAVRRTQ